MFRPLLLLAILLTYTSTFARHGVIQFAAPLTVITESPTEGERLLPTLTVTRTGGTQGTVTVDYCVWPSEVADNAVEDTHYFFYANTRKWVAAGRLTWADGDASPKTIPFSFMDEFGQGPFRPLRSSNGIDGTITYSARLVNLIGGDGLGPQATSRLHVLDAQSPQGGVLNFSARRFYATEGGPGALITVRRDGDSLGEVSVDYSTSSTLPPVFSGGFTIPAGVPGTHYLATSGTLTWADGDTSDKTFLVPLPATGLTTGPLHVALTLADPVGDYEPALGTAQTSLLTIQNRASATYNINDSVTLSTFRVTVPPGPAPVRGVLFFFPGSGGDDRAFATHAAFVNTAARWRFAVVAQRGNNTAAPTSINFPQPALSWLFDRLAQIALTTGRPEIEHAPFAFSGFSAGAYANGRALHVWPERTLGIMSHAGWDGLPWPLPAVPLDALQKQVPALLIPGSLDSNAAPSGIIPSFHTHRQHGLSRTAVAMGWNLDHHNYSPPLARNAFALYWLDQIMAAGRYPRTLAPTATTAPVLGTLALDTGWWGARNCTTSATNGYQLPGGSSRHLLIAPHATFTGVTNPADPSLDSWLPTPAAAHAYRGFASFPGITFSAPTLFSVGQVGQPRTLTVGLGSVTGVTRVEFFADSVLLGEDTTTPYTLDWTPQASGLRGVTAIAHGSSGPLSSAFRLLLVTESTAFTTFRTTHGLPADGSADLATPAGDGVPNLLKYAFNLIGSGPGQAPTLATPHSPTLAPDGSAGLPFADLAPTHALRLTYVRRKATTYPGITYAPEFASGLATPEAWAANPSATEAVTSIDTTWERVSVTDGGASATTSPRFARIRISTLP
jgi:hypothetical protein